MSEAARKNGQPCSRCGMKSGAHNWPRHPKACREWVNAHELQQDIEEDMGQWMIDPNMEDQG